MSAYAFPVGTRYGWEWLKWLAFAAMVADHLAVFFLGGALGPLRVVGLIAFPIFCLTFGFGLVQSFDTGRIAWRLLMPACIAQAAWDAFHPVPHLNVLFVLLACAFVVALYRERAWWGYAAAAVVVCASPWLEGGPFGLLLVAGGYLAGSPQAVRWPALVAGAAFALVTAVPLVAFAAVLVTLMPQPAIHVPRVRGLLLWGYPAHLLLLGFVSSLA